MGSGIANNLITLAVLVTLFCATKSDSIQSAAAAVTISNSTQTFDANHFAELSKYLERSSILYGLTAIASQLNIKGICVQQLQQLQQQILQQHPWALKVLDASGNRPDGFTYGNNLWLGSRQLCESLPIASTNKSADITAASSATPFALSYRMIYIHYDSPLKVHFIKYFDDILQLGLCLPTACSTSTIEALAAAYLRADLYVDNQIFSIKSQVLGVRDLSINENYLEKRSFKIVCAYLCFTVLMCVCATWLKQSSNTNILLRVIKCFDLQMNFSKLYTINEPTSKDVLVINGVHAISACAVVFLHMFFYSLFSVNNRLTALWYFDSVSPTAIIVDIFFTISGFLYAYHFLSSTKLLEIIHKNTYLQNVGLFLNLLFARFLRIAPIHYFITLLGDPFFTYIQDVSIFHSIDSVNPYHGCAHNTWRNFLFIQNLWDWDEICINWSWYLACEMQFYVGASMLLICYVKHPTAAKAIMRLMLLCNMALTFYIILQRNFQLQTEGYLSTMGAIYINPLVRITPYLCGLVVGICFHRAPQLLFSIFRAQYFYIFLCTAIPLALYYYNNSLTSVVAAGIAYFVGRCCIAIIISFFYSKQHPRFKGLVGACNAGEDFSASEPLILCSLYNQSNVDYIFLWHVKY